MDEAFLELWLEEVVATPGLTAIADPETARRVLIEDALKARELLSATPGEVCDVGSGGGSPGVPLAVALPERSFTLLEAQRRKADFLARVTAALPNVRVVWGRAEQQPIDAYGAVLARALASPPVAAELVLPLVEPSGSAVLWVGETVDEDHVARVAAALGAKLEASREGLLVLRKLGPTPPGFPRRPGMAKKRPLP